MTSARTQMIRLVGQLARRADQRLAHGAVRNAASSLRDLTAQRQDDARLLHDLSGGRPPSRPAGRASPAGRGPR